MADTQKEKIGLAENIRLNWQGCKQIHKITPVFFPSMAARALLLAAQPLVALFFSGMILNELTGARDVQKIALLAGGAVVLTFAITILSAMLGRVVDRCCSWGAAQAGINQLICDKYMGMDFAYTEDGKLSETLADLNTKMRGNGLGLMGLFYNGRSLVQDVFGLVLAAAMLAGMFVAKPGHTANFATSGWATLVLAELLLIGLWLMAIYRKREKVMMDEVFRLNGKSNNTAWYYNQYLKTDQAAKDIRLYGQRKALLHFFEQAYSGKNWWKFFFFGARESGFSAAMLALVSGGAYLLIGLRAVAGMYDVGSVVQYVGAITALAGSIVSLMSSAGWLANNAAYIKPMLDYLNLPPLLAKGERPLPETAGRDSVFEFRGVSFRYPGTDAMVLKDLNLTLKAGKRLAVVGLNGSGKTTMIKLLCRLYDPTEGEILLDGVNIKEYAYDAYHRLFSVVFQDFKLFPLELSQNVAVSATPDAGKVTQTLQDAGFGERLLRMPGGVGSVLYKEFDEEGVIVSGGEAQKIALARALYKNAPIVVLDEPTAALDPIAEFEVYSTFDKTIGGNTAVFISHRLSSCRFCDDIAVFEGGRMVQRGDHDALLAERDGLYRRLWNAQAEHYVQREGAREEALA